MLKYIALATTWLAPFGTFLVNYRIPISIGVGLFISKITPNAESYYHDKKIAENGKLIVNVDLFKAHRDWIDKNKADIARLNAEVPKVIEELYNLIEDNTNLRSYIVFSEDNKNRKWNPKNIEILQNFLNNYIPHPYSTLIHIILPDVNKVIEIYRSTRDATPKDKPYVFRNALYEEIRVQNVTTDKALRISKALESLDSTCKLINEKITNNTKKKTIEFNDNYLAERWRLLDKSLRSVAHSSIVLLASAVIPVSSTIKTIICGLGVLDAYKWAPKTTSVDAQEILREMSA